MDPPARSRVERSKKAPLWLSECRDSGESNASATFYEAEGAEEESSADDIPRPSPKKPRTITKRPSASAWKLSDSLRLGASRGLSHALGPTETIAAATKAQVPYQDGVGQDETSDVEPSGLAAASSGPPSKILELPEDLLARVLSCLPINILLQASGVCKAFAEASETIFETQCRIKKWRPPRRPRGDQAEIRLFPWRSLFRRHACQGCGKGGEFPVRVDFSGALAFLVCRRCAMNNRERLACESLYIDLVGISGKRLITNNKKNRFCYRRSMPQMQVQQS